jgi:hypothetical protein
MSAGGQVPHETYSEVARYRAWSEASQPEMSAAHALWLLLCSMPNLSVARQYALPRRSDNRPPRGVSGWSHPVFGTPFWDIQGGGTCTDYRHGVANEEAPTLWVRNAQLGRVDCVLAGTGSDGPKRAVRNGRRRGRAGRGCQR